ncbi:hypothetical protein [Sphingobium herbicidovorans]|jgi:hypothetical protein
MTFLVGFGDNTWSYLLSYLDHDTIVIVPRRHHRIHQKKVLKAAHIAAIRNTAWIVAPTLLLADRN